MKFKKKIIKKPQKEEEKMEVIVENIIQEEKTLQVEPLCKAKGCNRYAHTQGYCANCARDLKLL